MLTGDQMNGSSSGGVSSRSWLGGRSAIGSFSADRHRSRLPSPSLVSMFRSRVLTHWFPSLGHRRSPPWRVPPNGSRLS